MLYDRKLIHSAREPSTIITLATLGPIILEKNDFLELLDQLSPFHFGLLLHLDAFMDAIKYSKFRADIIAKIIEKISELKLEDTLEVRSWQSIISSQSDVLSHDEFREIHQKITNRRCKVIFWATYLWPKIMLSLLDKGLGLDEIYHIFHQALSSFLPEDKISELFSKHMLEISASISIDIVKKILPSIRKICGEDCYHDMLRQIIVKNPPAIIDSIFEYIDIETIKQHPSRVRRHLARMLAYSPPGLRKKILSKLSKVISWRDFVELIFDSISIAVKNNRDTEGFYEFLFKHLKETHEIALGEEVYNVCGALIYVANEINKSIDHLRMRFCFEDPYVYYDTMPHSPAFLLVEAFVGYLSSLRDQNDDFLYAVIKELYDFFRRKLKCEFWSRFLLLRIFSTIRERRNLIKRLRELIEKAVINVEAQIKEMLSNWLKFAESDYFNKLMAEEISEGYNSLYAIFRIPIWDSYLLKIMQFLLATVYAGEYEPIEHLLRHIFSTIENRPGATEYAFELIRVILRVLPQEFRTLAQDYVFSHIRELLVKHPKVVLFIHYEDFRLNDSDLRKILSEWHYDISVEAILELAKRAKTISTETLKKC